MTADLEVLRLPSLNDAVAEKLREMADVVENRARVCSAWAVTIVYADGGAGTTYGGDDDLRLVGALAITQTRVAKEKL